MKRNKTALAILALGHSMAFAGTMGPVCTPGHVTTPCPVNAWSLGGKALLLQPVYANSDLRYGNGVTVGSLSSSNTTWLDPNLNYGWGFELEGTYRFNQGNDLNINWYRDHSQTTMNPPINAPLGNNNSSTTSFLNDHVQIAPQWDAVNLELGQHLDFTAQSHARVFGGLQYARIHTNVNAYTTTGALFDRTASIKYNGFGPRTGVDLSYDVSQLMHALNGFSLDAQAAAALLVGPLAFNSNLTDVYGAAYTSGSHTAIVPELEAKIGGTYTYMTTHGNLDVNVGWMWNTYFNSQAISYSEASSPQTNLIYINTPTVSDFGLQGLYFGLKWTGSV